MSLVFGVCTHRFAGPAMLKGVVASVLASVLFGVIYWISPFLKPLGGEEIFGWRVLATLPFTTVLLLWRGEWTQVRELAQRVRQRPALGAALVLSAAMVGVQLWLFMWAPMAGRALPVSLGYFLLPLVMVLAGAVLYRERLSGPHKLATALAAAGVGAELLRAGGVSWETWLVAVGYPLYFALRRRLRTEKLGGHWVDMALAVPVALYFVLRAPSTLPVVVGDLPLAALVLVVGVLSAVRIGAVHGGQPVAADGLVWSADLCGAGAAGGGGAAAGRAAGAGAVADVRAGVCCGGRSGGGCAAPDPARAARDQKYEKNRC
jgi:chloramphenicol-sensitive protein RarD